MRYIKGTLDFWEKQNSVVTLGKFDGIHRGHQALIDRVLAYGDDSVTKTVFTFDIAPVMLLSKKERRKMLKNLGIDLVVECPFIADVITMEPETFVKQILVEQLKAVHIVVGADYRFGYHRSGNAKLLEELGERYGFTVEIVEKVSDGSREISSTYIREELEKGNIEKVNELLGYEFYITGEIVHGRKVGRTIGIPTTNLIPPKGKLLPPNGVYVTQTSIGGSLYYGMTNIGCKPTVEGSFVGVETYLFDFEGDLYGKKATVSLLHYIRPEKRFDGLEALKMQIKKDEEEIRAFIAKQLDK